MTFLKGPTLAEQRETLRTRLQVQRHAIETLLLAAAQPQDRYPRSVTMKLMIERPAAVDWVLSLVIGARFARALPLVLGVVHLMRAVAVDVHKRSLSATRHETRLVPPAASDSGTR